MLVDFRQFLCMVRIRLVGLPWLIRWCTNKLGWFVVIRWFTNMSYSIGSSRCVLIVSVRTGIGTVRIDRLVCFRLNCTCRSLLSFRTIL